MLDLLKHKDFEKWYEGLRDNMARKLILAHVRQVQVNEEFLGDCKPVGNGVMEMRVHFGPGYRIYAAIRRREVLLLLIGGDKSSQRADIEKAKDRLAEWIGENETEEASEDGEAGENGR